MSARSDSLPQRHRFIRERLDLPLDLQSDNHASAHRGHPGLLDGTHAVPAHRYATGQATASVERRNKSWIAQHLEAVPVWPHDVDTSHLTVTGPPRSSRWIRMNDVTNAIDP